MAQSNHLGSFTNIPGLRGQIDPETGKKWQFTPDLLWWRDYEKEKGPFIAQTKEGRLIAESPETGGYTGEPAKMIEATTGLRELQKRAVDITELKREPERPAIPDRKTYIKEFVLPRLKGIDPYTVNVDQKAEQLYRKNIDKAFKQVFPNIPVGGMLTAEQQKHWQLINEQQRQHYYNWAKRENNFQKDLYGHMMAEFEKMKAEKEAKEKERVTIEKRADELERFEKKEIIKAKYKVPPKESDYQTFKKEKPDYKGTILDFKKALKEKDADQVALELAAKDWKVLSGAKSLADAAIEYRKTWSILKEGKITELPAGLNEATIQFNMKKYNKTREEVIAKYKQMKGIK